MNTVSRRKFLVGLIIGGAATPSLLACTQPAAPATPVATSAATAPAATKPAATTPVAATASAASPISKATATTLSKEQQLVIGTGRELVYGSANRSYLHWSLNNWESLTYLGDDLSPQPLLAESWAPAADGLSWSFKLRSGVRYQDGAPFDAASAVTNIERLRKHSDIDAAVAFGDLKSVEAVDAGTVRFNLNSPAPALPAMINTFFSAMFSPRTIDAEGNLAQPVGTGPFRLVDWRKGESATLEANEAYWGKQGQIKRVTYRFIGDANTRVAALQAGELDAIADVGGVLPEQVPGLKTSSGIEISTRPLATTHYLFFNCRKGVFSQAAARQAVNLAVDRALLVKTAVGGFGTPGQSVITPMSTKWSLGDLAPKPDAARARELMQSAGAGSKALLLLSSGFTGRWPYKALAEMIQAALKDTGLEVEIRSVDGAAWGKAMKAGEYDFSLTPHTLMTGDPDFFFYSWLHSRGEMAKSRAHGYTSAEADSLIEQGAREQSESKRKQIYDDLQRLAARDLSIIPVYHETGILAARSYVKNLYMDVQFQVALTKISQEGKA